MTTPGCRARSASTSLLRSPDGTAAAAGAWVFAGAVALGFGALGALGSSPIFAGSSGSWSSGSSADPSGSGFELDFYNAEVTQNNLGGTAARRERAPPPTPPNASR